MLNQQAAFKPTPLTQRKKLYNVYLFQISVPTSLLSCFREGNWTSHTRVLPHTTHYFTQLKEGFMCSRPFLTPLFSCKCVPVGTLYRRSCLWKLIADCNWRADKRQRLINKASTAGCLSLGIILTLTHIRTLRPTLCLLPFCPLSLSLCVSPSWIFYHFHSPVVLLLLSLSLKHVSLPRFILPSFCLSFIPMSVERGFGIVLFYDTVRATTKKRPNLLS